MGRIIRWFITASAGLSFFTAVGHATTPDFYEGKIIRIIVGFSAGGAFDTYSRALSRHMRKHIPGSPTITVENMPGAGSLIAANHLYKAAKPDGLTIGNFIGTVLMGQVLGQKAIEFDARRFEYAGAPARYHPICVFSKASGITNLDKVKKFRLEVDPVDGNEVERIINDSFNLDAALIGKLKDILYK